MRDQFYLNGTEFIWTEAGIVGATDDMRYVADNYGDAVIVPFCGRNEELQDH